MTARPRHTLEPPPACVSDGGVAAVRQEVRVRAGSVRRSESPGRRTGTGAAAAAPFGRPRLGENRLAGHALLQQELGRLHAAVGVESFDEHVVADHVGERHERHSLMVRKKGAHDRPAAGWPLTAS